MLNHIVISRFFLVGLGLAGLYTSVCGKTPDTVTFIPCIFKSITTIPCPGCGMTRACLSITHGQFADALRFNPFSFFLITLAFCVAFFPVQFKHLWTNYSIKTQNIILMIGITFCLCTWVYKLMIFH